MESNIHPDTNAKEKEFSLKDLIFAIQDFSKEILRGWKLVLFFATLFIAFFLIKAFTTSITYTAELSFMVNEDEGGGMGGAMSILSQFGLAGPRSEYNLEKIVDLSKTRRISNLVFFEKISIKGTSDYIANHIIKLYDMHEDWDDDESPLQGFLFTSDSLTKFSRTENLALRIIHKRVLGRRGKPGLYATDINDDTGIMYLSMNSRSEDLSIKWTKLMYEHLSTYYVQKTIEKQKFTHKIVKEKVDSIKTILNNAEYSLANFKDTNRGLWTKAAAIKEQRLSREVQMLTLMYGEALKNLEIADFSLKNKTPFIQLIDAPIAPLSPSMESKLKSSIIGGILGVLLAMGIIVLRKIVRDSLA